MQDLYKEISEIFTADCRNLELLCSIYQSDMLISFFGIFFGNKASTYFLYLVIIRKQGGQIGKNITEIVLSGHIVLNDISKSKSVKKKK